MTGHQIAAARSALDRMKQEPGRSSYLEWLKAIADCDHLGPDGVPSLASQTPSSSFCTICLQTLPANWKLRDEGLF